MNMSVLKDFLSEKITNWILEIKRSYGVDATLNEIWVLPDSNCQSVLVDYSETIKGVTTRKVDVISIWPDTTHAQVYDIWCAQEGHRLTESQYKKFGIKPLPIIPIASIKLSKDSCAVNTTLKARVRGVAEAYCKGGTLKVGYVSHDNSRRYSSFTPANSGLPVLLICTELDNICDLCSMYPEGKGHLAIKNLKAEIMRQHNVGVRFYWSKQ